MIECLAGIGREFPDTAHVADGEEAGGRHQPLDRSSLPRWLLLFDHVAVQVAQGKLTSAAILATGGRDPRCGHQIQAVGVTGDTISLLFPLQSRCIGEGDRKFQGELLDRRLVNAMGSPGRVLRGGGGQ